MQYIEKSYVHEFLFDLEFIYDVKHLSRCRIWEICVYSCRTMQVFHRVIDPNPKMSVFPEPPLKSIPRLTRDFLSSEGALPFSAVFPMVIEWIHDQLRQTPGAIPVLISHNTFRSDKPILENECKRHKIPLPYQWYFFDSLFFSRDCMHVKDYSLNGLYRHFFGRDIENMHRAMTDVMACREILQHLGPLKGPMYPVYTTSLRFLDGFGAKAEQCLYQNGYFCLEDLVQTILRQMRMHRHFNLYAMFQCQCPYMPPNVIRQMVVSIKRYISRHYLLDVNC
tara:strand:- start:3947 stop:4786 length:840 start_codon:yes stop_codon:yes gene_type:complete